MCTLREPMTERCQCARLRRQKVNGMDFQRCREECSLGFYTRPPLPLDRHTRCVFVLQRRASPLSHTAEIPPRSPRRSGPTPAQTRADSNGSIRFSPDDSRSIQCKREGDRRRPHPHIHNTQQLRLRCKTLRRHSRMRLRINRHRSELRERSRHSAHLRILSSLHLTLGGNLTRLDRPSHPRTIPQFQATAHVLNPTRRYHSIYVYRCRCGLPPRCADKQQYKRAESSETPDREGSSAWASDLHTPAILFRSSLMFHSSPHLPHLLRDPFGELTGRHRAHMRAHRDETLCHRPVVVRFRAIVECGQT